VIDIQNFNWYLKLRSLLLRFEVQSNLHPWEVAVWDTNGRMTERPSFVGKAVVELLGWGGYMGDLFL
jgi:hypothetical protein